MMDRLRRRVVSSLLGILLIVLGLFAVLHVVRCQTAFERQFTKNWLLFAHSFADKAQIYLARGEEEGLRSIVQMTVMGSVFYAQVVAEGRIIAQEEAGELFPPGMELPITVLEEQVRLRRARLPDGMPYLEILYALPAADGPQGYVRIGVSLASVYQAVQREILLVVWVGLGLLLALGMGVSFLVKWIVGWSLTPAAEVGPEAAVPRGRLLEVGELVIDDEAKEVRLRGRAVELTPREYKVLRLLASRPGHVFATKEIIKTAWDDADSSPTSNDVKQVIYNLRRKLEEDPKRPQLIRTIRGFGYKLAVRSRP